MNWFLAKIIFQFWQADENQTNQFDEQIRLILAQDELHAFHKARLIGDKEGYLIDGIKGLSAKWKFIDVSELHLLQIEADGAEIYSSIKDESDAHSYIRKIKKSAGLLLEKACTGLPI